MKKTVIASALCSALSLPVYGGSIYVGDVRFFAKEVCSKEYTTTLSWNSGCLPRTRVSNVQNYFFEGIRLPISHDESKKLDQVSQEILADKPSELVYAADVLESQSLLFKSIQDAKSVLDKLDVSKKLQVANAITNLNGLKDEEKKKIGLPADIFTDINAVVKRAKDVTDKIPLSVLQDAKSAFENVSKLHSELQGKLVVLNDVASSKDITRVSPEYKAVIDAVDRLIAGAEVDKALGALKLAQGLEVNVERNIFDLQVKNLVETIANIGDYAKKLGEDDKAVADKLNEAAQALTAVLSVCQSNLAATAQLKLSSTDAIDALTGVKPIIQLKATATKSALSAIVPDATQIFTQTQLHVAADIVTDLLENKPSSSAIKNNLLPSLIGRVFVTQRKDSGNATDIRYKVPENGGNFQFIPLDDKSKVNYIKTEMLVNSDISGVLRKTVGVSGSVDLTPMIAAALAAAGIPPVKADHPQLKANLSDALSRSSVGTGNYYYVSMSADELDKLTGRTLKGYISYQPADRDEERQTHEPSRRGKEAESSVDCILINNLGITPLSLSVGEGLGIITGVAILRTRSARSEVCSSKEIAAYNPNKTPLSIGNDATACNELRNILAGHGVTSADIPAALASLSAGYRQESYKTSKVGDHASVLAIQWVPISIPKQKTALTVGAGAW